MLDDETAEGCPMVAGARSRARTASLVAKTSGFARAAWMVAGSSGQPGAIVLYPCSTKIPRQWSQLSAKTRADGPSLDPTNLGPFADVEPHGEA